MNIYILFTSILYSTWLSLDVWSFCGLILLRLWNCLGATLSSSIIDLAFWANPPQNPFFGSFILLKDVYSYTLESCNKKKTKIPQLTQMKNFHPKMKADLKIDSENSEICHFPPNLKKNHQYSIRYQYHTIPL